MAQKIPEPFYRGKVRDLYPVNDSCMIIAATDRISAFDVVFPRPIEGKGEILNGISLLWFHALDKASLFKKLNFDHQILADRVEDFPEPYKNYEPFRGRAILVKKTNRIDFECVVRAYLAGSGWKDYQKTGAVCGHRLPVGLENASKLPQPIFTPATKAPLGEHDENISIDRMRSDLGNQLADRIEEISQAIFNFAAAKMEKAGILLCDTKFEFGLLGDRIVLIDEVLTPDSSRYWDASTYRTGTSPAGFDKQYIRDYLESIEWNKKPPAPDLPEAVIHKTMDLYREIYTRIENVLKD